MYFFFVLYKILHELLSNTVSLPQITLKQNKTEKKKVKKFDTLRKKFPYEYTFGSYMREEERRRGVYIDDTNFHSKLHRDFTSRLSKGDVGNCVSVLYELCVSVCMYLCVLVCVWVNRDFHETSSDRKKYRNKSVLTWPSTSHYHSQFLSLGLIIYLLIPATFIRNCKHTLNIDSNLYSNFE